MGRQPTAKVESSRIACLKPMPDLSSLPPIRLHSREIASGFVYSILRRSLVWVIKGWAVLDKLLLICTKALQRRFRIMDYL
jgi:hypothetical protein